MASVHIVGEISGAVSYYASMYSPLLYFGLHAHGLWNLFFHWETAFGNSASAITKASELTWSMLVSVSFSVSVSVSVSGFAAASFSFS